MGSSTGSNESGTTASTGPEGAPGAEAVDPIPSEDATSAEAASVPGSATPSRRSALLRSGLILLVLFVVFGLILPKFVDYEEVAEALLALTIEQMVVMTILGIVAWFVCGQLFTVLIPGLRPLQGNAAYLILSGIGSSIPFGPWNMGVVWVVFRGWGVSLQAATAGIALYGIIATLGRFALPLFALVVIAATGEIGEGRQGALIIAVVSTLIFVVAVTVMLAVVRSDRTADEVAHVIERGTNWILAKLRRSEHPDVDGSIHRFRDSVGEIVHRRGLAGLGVNLLAQVPWCIAFVTALRFTGVPADVLSPGEIIGVFALVAVITIIPIAPGGAGVPELLYIAGLSAIAGPEWEAQITAGVFLFRMYVWFLPIPLAWILLKVARRGRPMLPTATEIRAYAGSAS
jgi:uncharacterized membrane protein YbhN (UPF0104 family)